MGIMWEDFTFNILVSLYVCLWGGRREEVPENCFREERKQKKNVTDAVIIWNDITIRR